MRNGNLRIALFGLFGGGNIGNEASLEVAVRYVQQRAPQVDLICICSGPRQVEERYHIPAIPIHTAPNRHWRNLPTSWLRGLSRLLFFPLSWAVGCQRIYACLRDVDAIVVPGTGILDDFGLRPFGLPLDILNWSILAKLRGTKILYICIGAGPIRRFPNRLLLRAAARLADYRSYRDEISRDFMSRIGVDVQNDPVCVDLVFSLPGACPPADRQQPTIAVGVMAYYGWSNDADRGEAIYREYLAKLCSFLQWLLQRRYAVRLLVGENTDERPITDLIKTVAVSSGASPGAPIIAQPIKSFGDLLEQAALADIVVATRFHNVVAALMAGKPVVSLGYAKKNDVLMQDMGLAQYCQQIEEFDVPLLTNHVEELLSNMANLRPCIVGKCRDYRERVERHLEEVFARLG